MKWVRLSQYQITYIVDFWPLLKGLIESMSEYETGRLTENTRGSENWQFDHELKLNRQDEVKPHQDHSPTQIHPTYDLEANPTQSTEYQQDPESGCRRGALLILGWIRSKTSSAVTRRVHMRKRSRSNNDIVEDMKNFIAIFKSCIVLLIVFKCTQSTSLLLSSTCTSVISKVHRRRVQLIPSLFMSCSTGHSTAKPLGWHIHWQKIPSWFWRQYSKIRFFLTRWNIYADSFCNSTLNYLHVINRQVDEACCQAKSTIHVQFFKRRETADDHSLAQDLASCWTFACDGSLFPHIEGWLARRSACWGIKFLEIVSHSANI